MTDVRGINTFRLFVHWHLLRYLHSIRITCNWRSAHSLAICVSLLVYDALATLDLEVSCFASTPSAPGPDPSFIYY
jgi:hypothetical protein